MANNEDLNQRLRSLVLGNASRQPENAREATMTRNSDGKVKYVQDSSKQISQGPRNSRGRSTQYQANQNSTQSIQHGRAGFAKQTGHQLTSAPTQKTRQVPLAQAPPTILTKAGRGRGPEGNGLNTAQRTGPTARGGARPSNFRPLSRPQKPTREEIQTQGLYIESLAQAELPGIEMTQEESARKELFRQHLEALLQSAANAQYRDEAPRITLVAFGSLASGFSMPGSDMDLALIASHIPEGMPRILESSLLQSRLGARLLTRTRVPILKVCEQPTPDLYQALCEERQKWDDMSPQEKEDHDRGPVRRKNVDHRNEEITKPEISQAATNGQDTNDGQQVAQDESAKSGIRPINKSNESEVVPAVTAAATRNGNDRTGNDTKAPLTPANRDLFKSPEHLQYFQLLDAVKKERPAELDKWIATNPPPQGFDLQTAVHGIANMRNQRRERPWYREKPLGPLDFPKHTVGILSDINFSNPLGIHNTALLHAYSTCDVRVRLLVLFVKLWASRRKINSGYNGTLSSYGYVLMVLHYMVNVVDPPVCPNLQLWETTRTEQSPGWPPERVYSQPDPNNPNHICEGADVRFHRNEAELASLASRQLLTHNREPLGLLLRNFFIYYAVQGPRSPRGGFNWTRDVLSLRSPEGLLSKQEKGWTGARTTEEEGGKEIKHRYLFAIEDPFELGHNVGRTVTHHGIVAIRDEFRRVERMLEKVGKGEMHDEGDLLAKVTVEIPKDERDPENVGEEGNEKEIQRARTQANPSSQINGPSASLPAAQLKENVEDAEQSMPVQCGALNDSDSATKS